MYDSMKEKHQFNKHRLRLSNKYNFPIIFKFVIHIALKMFIKNKDLKKKLSTVILILSTCKKNSDCVEACEKTEKK